jgi:hypothetical protein
MKKSIFTLALVLCFAIGNVTAQVKSKNFYDKVIKVADASGDIWTIDLFACQKTGSDMDTIRKTAMANALIECINADLELWKAYALKNKAKKPFILELKKIKGHEAEASEYQNQFKKIMALLLTPRTKWSLADVQLFCTYEKLGPYIYPIIVKFQNSAKDRLK